MLDSYLVVDLVTVALKGYGKISVYCGSLIDTDSDEMFDHKFIILLLALA